MLRFRRLSVLSFRTLLFETFRRNHIVVPFRNNFVDYYQIVKEQVSSAGSLSENQQTALPFVWSSSGVDLKWWR